MNILSKMSVQHVTNYCLSRNSSKLYKRKVYSVCLRMTGNIAEAEDLSQESLPGVSQVGHVRGESAFTTWAARA